MTMKLHTSRAVTFLLWAAVLTGNVVAEAAAAERDGNSSGQGQMVGVFTGRFADGVPIYRLPPVAVVASREAERARIEREEQLAREGASGTSRRQPFVAKLECPPSSQAR
jgi:hypothetical protein